MPITVNKKNLKEKGFTLIEMGIVLAIIGIALGSGLTIFNRYMKLSKIKETKQKMSVILQAIDDYVDKHNLIPCPADPSQLFSSTSFGVSNCNHVGALKSSDSSNKVVIGMIPSATLNIFPTLTMDGWGNRMSYIIREDAGASDGINASGIGLPMHNYSGTSAYTNVAVAIISHGENGFGAWGGASGSRLNSTGGNDKEDENATADGIFHASAPVAGYDDIVFFRTTEQLTDENFE